MGVYLESAASVADACRSKLSGLLWQPLKGMNEVTVTGSFIHACMNKVTITGSFVHTAALRPLLPNPRLRD